VARCTEADAWVAAHVPAPANALRDYSMQIAVAAALLAIFLLFQVLKYLQETADGALPTVMEIRARQQQQLEEDLRCAAVATGAVSDVARRRPLGV